MPAPALRGAHWKGKLMSTVLERYRDLSNFEYFTTATRVRKEITALGDFGGNAEVIPLRSGRADGRDGKKPCKQPCDGKRVLPQHRTQCYAAAALHDACRCQLRTAVAKTCNA